MAESESDELPGTSHQTGGGAIDMSFSVSEALDELVLDSDSDDSDLDMEDVEDEWTPSANYNNEPDDNDEDDLDLGTQSDCSEEASDDNVDLHHDNSSSTSPLVQQQNQVPLVSQAEVQRLRKRFVLETLQINDANWLLANNTTATTHAFTSQKEILVDTTDFSSLDFYKLFISDAVIDHIVAQTNKYAADYISNPPAPLKSQSPEVKSRTQGSRPRPRTQKKSEAKAKDSLSEDRHSRGQGQECSRPRTKDTSASALQKKRSSQKFFRRSPKKRSLQKFFRQSPQKNVFQKIFQALHKILTIQKIVLSSSRGQANFRGLEASRPRT